MAVYMIITYDVTDPERFKDYNPGSLSDIFATISKHGGSIVGAGPTDAVEGSTEQTCVIVNFPDADAAKAWAADDEYAPMKAIRYEASSNTTEFIVPAL